MALEKRKKTGKYCVVYGCCSTHVDELSLHCFPKDDRPYLRIQWIQFVQETRPDFQQPTVHSVLCERHFTSDCYPREYRLKRMLNIPILKKKLLPDAVPSIHPEASSPASPPVISSPAPKKMRPVFSRGLMDITHTCNFSIENEISEMETDKENNEPDLPPISVGIQVEQQRVRPRRKSKRVQTKVNGVDKAIQVDLRNKPVYRTVGTQCNLDLKEEQQNPTVCSTLGSSPLIDFTTHQNSPTVAIDKDSDYLPCSDEEFTDNDSDFSDAQFSERKFIVYESQLLQLFDCCPACSFPTLNSVKHVLGTMVQIQQECGSCGLNRLWNSQPMTGAIPDGNLLLSSAILFSVTPVY